MRPRCRAVPLFALGLTAAMSSRASDENWRELGHPLMRTYPPGLHLYHPESQTMAQDAAGWVYFANGGDLLCFNGTNWIFRRLPTESAGIRQFAIAGDGTIYGGGAGVLGYLRGAGPALEFVSLADRLPEGFRNIDDIRFAAAAGDTAAFADHEKILLWHGGRFTAIPCAAPAGQRGARVHAVRGALLVSAPGQPLRRVRGDELVAVADGPAIRENQLVTVVADETTGGFIALTDEHGFLAIDAEGRTAPLEIEANRWLAGKHVYRARRLDDGSWAVAFGAIDGGGGMRFAPDGRFAGPVGLKSGIYTDQVRDYVPDREGGLWVMLSAGAVRLDWPSPATLFDAFNGLGHGAVTAIACHDGRLLAETDEGLFELRPAIDDRGAQFEKITRPVNEPWTEKFARSRRAAAAAFTPTAAIAQWPTFVRAAVGEVACAMDEETPAGRVRWIGGAGGLVRVELARAFPLPPPLVLRVSASGVASGSELPTEHDPLTFRFLAIRQQRANPVQYQTRLVGHDRNWSAWGAGRERFFAHLSSGRYVFEVRARDADGVTSEVASLAFAVRAPWWLTGWALAGYAVGLGAVIAGAVRLRTRGLERRAVQLEQVVAERTAELAQKNRELTRLHQLELDEKIAARLAEDKARLEVLRYQLNPHFLFNTLASISASLPAGPSRGRSMVERLAEFCRLTLQRTDENDWTTLGDEMRLLRAYLAIEQSRWGELLVVDLRHDSALDAERLPYFLLLPLVENALKYGRATSPDHVGLRLVTRRGVAGGLEIEVANTGEWVEPTARKSVATLGIGLENLRQRLARYYPRAHRFEFAAAAGWVVARLQLSARPPAERAEARAVF